MKPFNLEEAKAGKPIVTRDGRKAKFIAHVPEAGEPYRLIALVDGNRSPSAYCDDGRPYSPQNHHDLFMAEEEKKPVVRWLWAHLDCDITLHMYTEEELQANGIRNAIKLEWSRTEFPE